MEFTPELLRQYAETLVEKRTREDYSVLAVYLTGSILTEQDPFLGGTTDIDLVFVHVGDPEKNREFLPINEDVHYDFLHHPQRKYLDRISLRVDPLMGPILSEAVVLYDPQHFIDLTQASVRGLYYQRENVVLRAQTLSKTARSKWFEFQPPPKTLGPSEILAYLGILNSAANAIALLVGELLTERRFLINLEQLSKKIGKPGFYPGFLGMLGAPQTDIDLLKGWTKDWEKDYKVISKNQAVPVLNPIRFNYYYKGFEHILGGDQPVNILWALLRTWTLMAGSFQENDKGFQNWKDAMRHLKLLDDGFAERLLALDALLDQIENVIHHWDFS